MRLTKIIGLLAVLALIVVACGSGGETTTTGSGEPATTEPTGTAAAPAETTTSMGGDNTSGNGDRGLDICSLITPEEAGQWIGAPVSTDPTEDVEGIPELVTCDYVGGHAHVYVQVYDSAIYFAEPGSASRVGEDVDGLGEDAFMESDSVEFLQNDWTVSVSQISGQVETDGLLEMAHLISSRLP